MNTQDADSKFLVVFRNTHWHEGLSAEQMQQVASDWMAWFQRLTAEGKALAGNPLGAEGRVLTQTNGRIVVDGPFVEAKETVGGYFLLRVDSMEEATAIARECPGLPYGVIVEVRPVLHQCPLTKELESKRELAEAAV